MTDTQINNDLRLETREGEFGLFEKNSNLLKAMDNFIYSCEVGKFFVDQGVVSDKFKLPSFSFDATQTTAAARKRTSDIFNRSLKNHAIFSDPYIKKIDLKRDRARPGDLPGGRLRNLPYKYGIKILSDTLIPVEEVVHQLNTDLAPDRNNPHMIMALSSAQKEYFLDTTFALFARNSPNNLNENQPIIRASQDEHIDHRLILGNQSRLSNFKNFINDNFNIVFTFRHERYRSSLKILEALNEDPTCRFRSSGRTNNNTLLMYTVDGSSMVEPTPSRPGYCITAHYYNNFPANWDHYNRDFLNNIISPVMRPIMVNEQRNNGYVGSPNHQSIQLFMNGLIDSCNIGVNDRTFNFLENGTRWNFSFPNNLFGYAIPATLQSEIHFIPRAVDGSQNIVINRKCIGTNINIKVDNGRDTSIESVYGSFERFFDGLKNILGENSHANSNNS